MHSLRSGKLHSRPKEARRVPIYVNRKIVAKKKKKANNTMMEILSFASRESLV